MAATGAEVAVSNPNLWLANQLGLINPGTIALELVPFSFVFGWFVNLEQVISSMTDLYGLTLSNGWKSLAFNGVYQMTYYGQYKWSELVNGVPTTIIGAPHTRSFGQVVSTMKRDLGLLRPVLHIAPLKAPHWRRAATAVSLLVLLGLRGP